MTQVLSARPKGPESAASACRAPRGSANGDFYILGNLPGVLTHIRDEIVK